MPIWLKILVTYMAFSVAGSVIAMLLAIATEFRHRWLDRAVYALYLPPLFILILGCFAAAALKVWY